MPIPGVMTYQVVNGALGSGRVGPLPPPLLLNLLIEPACDLGTAGGTELATGWGAGKAPDGTMPGAAKCMLNAEGCWREGSGNGIPVPMPMPIREVDKEL